MKQNDISAPTEELAPYGRPEIADYGTLADLTEAGHVTNSDVPLGTPNSAFSSL